MIKDIKMKTSGLATGKFMVSKLEYKAFSNKPGNFLSCELGDMSGTIKAVMWDGVEACKTWLKNKIVADVVGEITTYKDVPQIQIKSIAQAHIYDAKDFIQSLDPGKIGAFYDELTSIKIKNPVCKKIWDKVLSEKERFCSCPGGVGDVHHAYIGGLLDHTCMMVRVAEEVVKDHWGLDRDLVLTGCLVHDIGKMECYNWFPVIEMSDTGRLFHHTFTGYLMLMDMAAELGIPRSDLTLLRLAHIIASHHEDEGIKKTEFPEATAVGYIDNLNAQTNFILGFVGKEENKDPESNWTRFCQLTGRQYFLPKISEKPEAPPVMESKKPKAKPEAPSFDIDSILGDVE